jgi:hypothetical protein
VVVGVTEPVQPAATVQLLATSSVLMVARLLTALVVLQATTGQATAVTVAVK